MPQKVMYDIGTLFPEVGIQGQIAGFNEPVPGYTPDRIPGYRFRSDVFMDLNAFFTSRRYTTAKLKGEKGAGKSTAVREFLARLNYPLVSKTCDGDTKIPHLLGHYVPKEGGVEFDPGPVMLAMQFGWPLLLDEFNLAATEVATGLNGVFEGAAEYSKELRQVVRPPEGWKIFLAVNPRKGLYGGRQKGDGSNADRCMNIEVTYPTADEEIPLVIDEINRSAIDAKGDPVLDADTAMEQAKLFCEVAQRIRAAYLSDNDDRLSNVLSTRSLLGWVELHILYSNLEAKGKAPVHVALSKALTAADEVTPETREAMHAIVTDVFGVGPDL